MTSGLVGIGLALAASNAVRVSESVTASDLGLAAAAVAGTVVLLAKRDDLFLPVWLVLGATLLAAAICIAELFHPILVTRDSILYYASLGTPDPGGHESGNLDLGFRLLVAAVALPLIVAIPPTTTNRVDAFATIWLVGTTAS